MYIFYPAPKKEKDKSYSLRNINEKKRLLTKILFLFKKNHYRKLEARSKINKKWHGYRIYISNKQ
ncbi:MAG: hypothetical protein D3909_14710 [Candidatus Electrothrix sp. ATG1]|nr:hypothetical protein [Candidatus Electrothrix sp. ATG1]